jgi:hypothetical protein
VSGPPTAADIPWQPGPPDSRPSAILLRDVLHDLRAFVRRFVVVTEAQAIAIALWIAHTHVLDAFDCTPYLQITSATKRAGKTRLLEVLEPLVARPWLTQRMSAAALVRKVDKESPTLLLDESDAAFKGEKDYAEALRGLLNSGYRRSGRATICVGQGANLTYRDFSTFSAKAIAGIGELPDTVADRAIAIALRRRTQDEPCERWREKDGHAEAAPYHEALVAWAGHAEILDTLRGTRPAPPAQLSDRQADIWEPLLAIADLAGATWPAEARQAAGALTATVEDQDVRVELLQDIQEILATMPDDEPVILTKDLLAKLVERDERPWATWRHDKPMTSNALARLLGPLAIHPDRHARTARGYRTDAFQDAIARYLPSEVSHRHNANKTGPEVPKTDVSHDPNCDASKNADHPDKHWGCDTVTVETPDQGETESLSEVIRRAADDRFRKGW